MNPPKGAIGGIAMAWMEPYPGAGYDEVPWYRKTWFFIVLLFTIWPLTLVITLTGDLYQKANKRQRRHSDAEVWRSTGSGKAVMVLSAAMLGAMASVQYWAAFSNRETATPRREIPAAAPASELETTTATTPTTAAPTTTTLPDSDGLPEFMAELQAFGAAGFATQDPAEAIALLSDRFGALPDAGQARIKDFSIITSDHTEDEASYTARVSYLTDLSVGDAAGVYRSAEILQIPVTGEETSATDLGEEVEFEYWSSQVPHPDPAVRRATSFVTIEDTEDGVTISVTRTISFDGEPLTNAALQTRLAELLPLADGYTNEATAISFLTIEPNAATPAFSLSVETTSLQPLASTDDAAEAERFADVAEAGGLWSRKDTTDSGVILERLDETFVGDLFINGRRSDSANLVRMSIRIL